MFATVFPGEGAHLLTVWNGLDPATAPSHPLMGLFAKPFGLTNALAPVLGVLATVALALLAARLVRRATTGEDTAVDARKGAWTAGLATAVAFALSPAVLSAASRLEPALFALVVTLVAAHALLGALAVRAAAFYLLVPLAGLLWGFVAGECPLAVACLPLAAVAILLAGLRSRGLSRAIAALALFALGASVGTAAYVGAFSPDFASAVIAVKRGLLGQFHVADDAGRGRAVFAALPFLATLLLLARSFGEKARTLRPAFGFAAVLVLSLFGLFSDFGPDSVASAAFAAFSAGVALAFFLVSGRAAARCRPPEGVRFRNFAPVLRFFLAGLLTIGLFASALTAVHRFNPSDDAFADLFAERVLDSLGSRVWLVTDGRLDDHLRVQAARRGQDIVLVNALRDFDPEAKRALASDVTRRLGARAPELLRSLDLGILPFLEDWVKADPAATNVLAVMAAPDILFSCGVAPVPEVYFFGCDPEAPADWSVWTSLADILSAPKGWGSARLGDERDARARRRLDLRRHLGLVANNRGVWLQDRGDDAGAYRMYALVLDEIDADNVSALFNLLALADAKFEPAAKRRHELDRRMRAIVADETRRYRLWALANYYGTVRNVSALLQLGFAWARSGRPGEALAQIRRAADLVPSEQRDNLMNMIASLLADADRREESRRIFERRLAAKADDHAALIGLVRLELLSGDEAKARAYLARAVRAGGDDPRVRTEMAVLALMRGNVPEARDILRSVVATDPGNVRAWSLLTAVTMQLSDAEKDAAKRAALDRELEEKLLPEMRTRARGDEAYYVRSAEAFLALRKGEAERKAAREALIAAAQIRPDAPLTREMLIGVDVAMSDPVAAEAHARVALRQDRNSPMANYVMGSLALGKGDLAGAEAYLRRAVQPKRPSAFALNDLAETLRLKGEFAEAETYARRVTKDYPSLYAGWDTLAAVILDRKGDADEALAAAQKSVELVTRNGRAGDATVLLTLARAQVAKGDRRMASMTLRKLESRTGELNDRQRAEFDKLRLKP